jgi:uncharacterized OsmC-like protein
MNRAVKERSMSLHKVAHAMERAVNALTRRPDLARHDDTRADARWEGGLRVTTVHENGSVIATDMPTELGGAGDRVTPGWLFRASLASCAVTSIAMRAAAEGVELTALDVTVTSRSDTRGLLGMTDAAGDPFSPGPGQLQLRVRIEAPGVPAGRLRALVESGCRCSPVPNTVQQATPVEIVVEVAAQRTPAQAPRE